MQPDVLVNENSVVSRLGLISVKQRKLNLFWSYTTGTC